MSETFAYACEKCGGAVVLTRDQYRERKAKGGKWGAKVLCVDHAPQAKPVAPKPKRKQTWLGRRPLEMPKTEKFRLRHDERDDYGVTCTIRDQKTGEVDVLVAGGPPAQALLEACRLIDAREGDWRIITISTPATIFSDLQGMRDHAIASLEDAMLGKAGRRDLLEDGPRLIMRVVA